MKQIGNLIIRKLKIPLFGGTVDIIIFNKNHKEVISYVNDKYGFGMSEDDLDRSNMGLFYSEVIEKSGLTKFIIIAKNSIKAESTLAHEIWHLNEEVLSHFGVTRKAEDNNETPCLHV